MSMHLKHAGNSIYLVGSTGNDLGGSLALRLEGQRGGRAPAMHPEADRSTLGAVHRALRKGLVRSCHDLSEGGLGVAAAEMAISGGLGLELDVGAMAISGSWLSDAARLFAESPTRFLVEVDYRDEVEFETLLRRVPHARIGRVLAERRLVIRAAARPLIDRDVETLRACWQTPLDEVQA
jgi:phosphoribosylformylglycinamidine synthase